MPKDFHEQLAEKQGIHTPTKEWRDAEKDLEDTEVLVMIHYTKEGYVFARSSQADILTIIGMLETAKLQMFMD